MWNLRYLNCMILTIYLHLSFNTVSNAVILKPLFSTDHYHAVVVSALFACVYKQDGFAH